MTHPLVERILSGNVPSQVKQAAARGALPIPRENLLELWAVLRSDLDPEIRTASKESLAGVDDEEWLQYLPDQAFGEEFFGFAVKVLARKRELASALLRNKNLPANAVVELSRTAEGVVVDQIIDNQNRLLEHPEILKGLLSNPKITPSQVRRLFDISEQFFRDKEEIVRIFETRFSLKIGHAGGAFEAPEREVSKKEEPQAAEAEPQAAAPPEESAADIADIDISAEELSEDLTEEDFRNLYQRIMKMSVPEKVGLALKGNKEARTLLLRDSNKTVQEAVLDSPKLTDAEVEAVARMRNIPVDIIRKVFRNKDWMKNYTVVKGLVTNPKTPPALAMPLVQRLVDQDLKFLVKDRNVTEIVRREARKIWDLRHSPKKPAYLKK
ncbi:MAG: hypothetical protein P8018_10110 [Acidobacteriota bacterium]|jgi:hypothetical protein